MILKIDSDTVTVKLQKSRMTSFVIKITSPKIRHEDDVTKIVHFQDPS